MRNEYLIRTAVGSDLPGMLVLEKQFPGDRLSPRQFQYHHTRPSSLLRSALRHGELSGYALTLLRADSPAARLYSIVVAPAARGAGLGRRLLIDAEQVALDAGAVELRLEVRADNLAAIALYRAQNYHQFRRWPDYYEDGEAALRFCRDLR